MFDVLFEPTSQEPHGSTKAVSPREIHIDIVKADSCTVRFWVVVAECVHDKVGVADIAYPMAVRMPETFGLGNRVAVERCDSIGVPEHVSVLRVRQRCQRFIVFGEHVPAEVTTVAGLGDGDAIRKCELRWVHEALGRTTEGFYDTALNEANDV